MKEKKLEVKDRILRFLTRMDITLTAAEEAVLTRWEFADLMMRQGITLTEALNQKIIDRFSVSRFTAESDVVAAMEIFSKSRKINRKYLGHLHLQDIAADLTRMRGALFKDKATPDSKELQALSKLHDAYTYQLNSLPEDVERPAVGKIVMQFVLPGSQTLAEPMSITDALLLADKIIDIEHEELNMEDRKAQD